MTGWDACTEGYWRTTALSTRSPQRCKGRAPAACRLVPTTARQRGGQPPEWPWVCFYFTEPPRCFLVNQKTDIWQYINGRATTRSELNWPAAPPRRTEDGAQRAHSRGRRTAELHGKLPRLTRSCGASGTAAGRSETPAASGDTPDEGPRYSDRGLTEFSRDQCDRLLKTRNTGTFKRGEQRNILKTICKILSKVWHLVEVTHFGLEFLHELRPFTSKKKKKYRLKQPSVEPCTGESSLKCHWYVQIIKSLTLQK